MRRILRWIGIGVLSIVVLGVFLLGGPIAWEMATGVSATNFTNVTYSATDGTELHGYLATPEEEGSYPAVLLIHEWWGLNEDITHIADQLAEEGYIVLAPDAYRGKLTAQVPRALYITLNMSAEMVESDLDDALAYLRAHPDVDPENVASWGFCFGGRQSMYLGTRHGDLAAVITYYGGGPITDPAELGDMNGPVLGIWGADDQQIPLSEVDAFQAALNSRGIENEFTVYQEVGHAFLDSENLNDPNHPASAAWAQTLAFLDRNME